MFINLLNRKRWRVDICFGFAGSQLAPFNQAPFYAN